MERSVRLLLANALYVHKKDVDLDQTFSGKNKKYNKYNKLSSVELAMGQLIQLYSVCVGEFLVCMQFNAKKKKNQTLIKRCILCHLLN